MNNRRKKLQLLLEIILLTSKDLGFLQNSLGIMLFIPMSRPEISFCCLSVSLNLQFLTPF